MKKIALLALLLISGPAFSEPKLELSTKTLTESQKLALSLNNTGGNSYLSIEDFPNRPVTQKLDVSLQQCVLRAIDLAMIRSKDSVDQLDIFEEVRAKYVVNKNKNVVDVVLIRAPMSPEKQESIIRNHQREETRQKVLAGHEISVIATYRCRS